jgi:Ca2+-transporting ATPase
MKDKQFVRLQSIIKDEDIAVIRGKYGATQSVNVYKLVVGDIILLEAGSRVPADCIIVEGQDVTIDESFYHKGDNRAVKKEASNSENYTTADPFLLSQTLITSGSAKAVVCCVGKYSRRGIQEEKLDTESKTPLQVKLENLGGTFTKWGIYASLAILIANFVNLTITLIALEDFKFASSQTLEYIVSYITLSITIVIVAVPEGLPLTIAISLAYSVMRMKNDKILVRNLDSPEVMGRVDEICTGKTATLTKNEMSVAQFYAQTLLIRNTRKNTLFNCELEKNMI